jgi:hypothetical protein
MRRRGLVVLAVLTLMASSLACSFCFSIPVPGLQAVRGSGDVVEETRDVSGFTGVSLETIGDLYIEVGEQEGLLIEAEESLIPYIETEVQNDVLEIGTASGVNLRPSEPIRFYLTVEELDSIKLAGSGDIEAPDLEAGRFSVTISGSGEVDMGDLYADSLEIAISGSGDLEISGGEVEDQEISISGSGGYDARDMQSAEARLHISGSGSAVVWVSERLDASISGSGTVRYVGSPAVEVRASGSGSVEQIGE